MTDFQALAGSGKPAAVVDPRLRALLLAVRHALLILADGIGDYLSLEKRL